MTDYGGPFNGTTRTPAALPAGCVDVDFQEAAREARRDLGCRVKPPDERRFGSVSPIFEERFAEKIIPRGEWDAAYEELKPDYARSKTWQYDQNGEGTCTANATSGCMSYTWAEQFGKQFPIAPAPTTIYRHCARGPNSGSSCSCCLKRARDNGALLINHESNRDVLRRLGLNPDHVVPAVGWNSRIPSGAMEETARHFRIDEFYEISSVDGFFSALLLGFSILYGRSGHAIHGVDIVKRNGTWYCKYDNSWGSWGDQGFGFDSLDYIRRASGAYGSYAVQTLVIPDGIDKMIEAPRLAA